MPRINEIIIRNGTATAWTTANPVLSAGELGFETDTRKAKLGDGASTWSALQYLWADLDLSITDTSVVGSQAAMLALTAQKGDVAIRTDNSTTYILTASPATTLANWQALPQVAAPSVMTGATAGAAGAAGLAPQPAAGAQNSFLRGDATYSNVINGGTP